MNILLTGITGFLGSHLSKQILDKGYKLIGVKRFSSNLDKLYSMVDKNDPRLTIVNSTDNLCDTISEYKISLIIHTATIYDSGHDVTFDDILEANELFPLKILTYAFYNNIPFINSHSSLPNFTNRYIVAKNNFLNWGLYYRQQSKSFKFVNLEIEHFYGYKDGRFIEYLITSLLQQKKNIDLTLGEQNRDFIYIDDLVDIFMLIINKLNLLELEYWDIPVGSGTAVSIKDLAILVKKIMNNNNTNLNFGAISYRKNEPMKLEADVSTLKKLGWSPKFSLESGIRACVSKYDSEH